MTAHQVSILLSGLATGLLLVAVVQRRWTTAILGLIILVVAVPMFLLTTL